MRVYFKFSLLYGCKNPACSFLSVIVYGFLQICIHNSGLRYMQQTPGDLNLSPAFRLLLHLSLDISLCVLHGYYKCFNRKGRQVFRPPDRVIRAGKGR